MKYIILTKLGPLELYHKPGIGWVVSRKSAFEFGTREGAEQVAKRINEDRRKRCSAVAPCEVQEARGFDAAE